MTKKIFFSAFFSFCLATLSFSQLEKTIHQTFDVSQSNAISFDLVSDSTVIVPWAGNNVLTETKIELYDASPSILKHFIEKDQRYAIQADSTSGVFRLSSVKMKREPIRTKNGECYENVQIRLFVPDDFELQGKNKLVRVDEN
ncbi:MAG TPA: hypothetical protein ENJ95_18985 [Bacteroidetes bacterium]|nr:hypothetical protein [Bacteroidota bacterium]